MNEGAAGCLANLRRDAEKDTIMCDYAGLTLQSRLDGVSPYQGEQRLIERKAVETTVGDFKLEI